MERSKTSQAPSPEVFHKESETRPVGKTTQNKNETLGKKFLEFGRNAK